VTEERTIRTLAHEYDDAPAAPGRGSPLRAYWKAYGDFLRERAAYLCRDLTVKECRFEAYGGGEELAADVTTRRRLVVTRDFAPHPVWDLATNQAMRIVHDIDGHAGTGEGFTFEEEVKALRRQAKFTPFRFLPALFAQTLHQLASTTHNRKFPDEQKVYLTRHGEMRATLLNTGRALDAPGSHDHCEECDIEHPHTHLKENA
jgi:hypothetical protein